MKKTGKRWLAALLAVIMTVGVLPMSALAAETGSDAPAPVVDTEKSAEATGANLVKTARYDPETGKYTITLESWVTGSVKPGSTKPMDIVLLLDVSGSMDDPLTTVTKDQYTKYEKKTKNWQYYEWYSDDLWYQLDDGTYVQVTVTRKWTGRHFEYTYTWAGQATPVVSTGADKRPGITLYYKTSANVSKLEALQSAVSKFIDTVAEKSPTSKISIVKFAGDETDRIGNDTYNEFGYRHNYTQIVRKLTTADEAGGVTALKSAVNDLRPAGATAADYGMDMAKKALADSTDATRDKVVIMFTDGEPNHQNGWDGTVANDAISKAKDLKDVGTKIFTIGVFENAKPKKNNGSDNLDGNFNEYMHGVSSNYPAATSIDNLGTRGTGDYYYAATDSVNLDSIFVAIADTIEPNVEAGADTVLSDTLSGYFNFANLDADGNLTGYTVKTVDYAGKDANGNYLWADTMNDVTGVTVEVSNMTVTATGFDYAANAVVMNGDTPSGKKLVVTFEITPNANADWAEGTNNYPTNANTTGASMSSETGDPFATVPISPELPMTAYKVSYKYEGTIPSNPPKAPDPEIILPGTSVTVEPTPGNVEENGYTYTFDGWYLGSAKAEGTITPTGSIELVGSWTRDANAANYKVEYYLQNLAGDGYDLDTDPTRTRKVASTTGASVSETPAAIEGFIFDGTAEGTQTSGTVAADGSLVLKLYYTRNSYEVSYEYTGTVPTEAPAKPANEDHKYDEAVTVDTTVTAATTITGADGYTYQFSGWTTNDAAITNGAFTMPAGDVKLTGTWTRDAIVYHITYELDGGTVTPSNPGTYTAETDTFTLNNPTRDGYTFLGWTGTGLDGMTKEVTITKGSTGDRAYTAHWQKDDVITEVTVTFVVVNGTWNAEGSTTKTVPVTLTNGEGLLGDVIPVSTPNTGYSNGKWDAPAPTAGTIITEPTTFTYRYSKLPTLILGGDTDADFNIKKDLATIGYVEDTFSETFTVNVTEYGYAELAGEFQRTSGTAPQFSGTTAAMTAAGTASFGSWTVVTATSADSRYTFDAATGTLTFKQAGIYFFAVEEVEGGNTRMHYDGDEYGLAIAVKADETTGDLAVTKCAVIDLYGNKIKDFIQYSDKYTGDTEISIENLYEGDPDTFPVKLGDFVKKTYTSTYSYSNTADFSFTANIVKYDRPDVYSLTAPEPAADLSKPLAGSVRITTGETKDVDFGTIYLEEGTYFVEVSEVKGSLTDVEYDGTVYRFTVTIELDGEGKAVVEYSNLMAGTANGGFTELERGAKAVFHNKYNYNSTVIIPPVPTTPDLNTEDHVAYLIGFTDGTIRPEANITRGEVATIFFRLLTDESRTRNWSQTNSYSDVPSDLWCNNAISTLSNMGIINGYTDGTFRPAAPITRSELTKIAVSFFQYADSQGYAYDGRFPDVKGTEWYARYLAAAVEFGLIEGDGNGNFRPDDSITRAETCTIVNRTLGRKPDAAHLLGYDVMITWPDNSNINAWYYAAMQEATNSHDYNWVHQTQGQERFESWTAKLAERDWAALERMWSNANSAPGGEVID